MQNHYQYVRMLAFIRLPVPPASKTNPTSAISGVSKSSSPLGDPCARRATDDSVNVVVVDDGSDDDNGNDSADGNTILYAEAEHVSHASETSKPKRSILVVVASTRASMVLSSMRIRRGG